MERLSLVVCLAVLIGGGLLACDRGYGATPPSLLVVSLNAEGMVVVPQTVMVPVVESKDIQLRGGEVKQVSEVYVMPECREKRFRPKDVAAYQANGKPVATGKLVELLGEGPTVAATSYDRRISPLYLSALRGTTLCLVLPSRVQAEDRSADTRDARSLELDRLFGDEEIPPAPEAPELPAPPL